MRPVIIVCGPTATGKSDLAVDLALSIKKRFRLPAEVVSADSRQVYRGLDLGSGKVSKGEMRGVPHHLLDVVRPEARGERGRFTAERYRALARRAIADIHARGGIPIVCGGTGFYIDAAVLDLPLADVPPDPKLRAELSKLSADQLFSRLSRLDPKRAASIDRRNPRRLARAIEIAAALGASPERERPEDASSPYDLFWIGTRIDDQRLRERIRLRLLARLRRGMLAEARRLHTGGLSWRRMEELGLEYRYMALHLQGALSREEMIEELSNRIWQYARRQKTWWRKRDIHWLDPLSKKARAAAIRGAERWLQSSFKKTPGRDIFIRTGL